MLEFCRCGRIIHPVYRIEGKCEDCFANAQPQNLPGQRQPHISRRVYDTPQPRRTRGANHKETR